VNKKANPHFLNGVPELLVLRLLDSKEMYGYELVAEIKDATGGKLSFEEGCIYPTLHSLEEDGFLQSSRKIANGRARYYYRLSGKGGKRLSQLKEEWKRVSSGVAICLGGLHERPA